MKILVPVDGSPYSLKAVETAVELAKAKPSTSLVITAVAVEIPELEEGVYIAEKMRAQAQAHFLYRRYPRRPAGSSAPCRAHQLQR